MSEYDHFERREAMEMASDELEGLRARVTELETKVGEQRKELRNLNKLNDELHNKVCELSGTWRTKGTQPFRPTYAELCTKLAMIAQLPGAWEYIAATNGALIPDSATAPVLRTCAAELRAALGVP